jgi:sigma-B regulation protein RsbU (phosphoserine phosphatase)
LRSIDEVNERGFGEILDFINSGVYVTDTERRIVFWNRAAERITGYSASEVRGRSCAANVLNHIDKDGHRLCVTELCPLHRAMVRGVRTEYPMVVYALTKDGSRLPLSTSAAAVLDDEGRVIGGVEVFRDESQTLKEMELARVVQKQMLTAELPAGERVSFDVRYLPREMIGGDFYHVRRLPDGAFSAFLGDAAGHGPSAALYCALIYGMITECADLLGDPAALCSAVNRLACARAGGLGFFTAVCFVVDANAAGATYCSAGHPPLLLQRAAGGAPEMLEDSDLPIGIDDAASYHASIVELAPGDRLLAYTDGATDVVTGPERRLGLGGLAELSAAFPPADGRHRLEALYGALIERSATVEPDDDITLLSCMVR